MAHWGWSSFGERARTALVWALPCLLVGCGGGSSQSPDPVAPDYPIAYVKRPLPENPRDLRGADLRRALTFRAGGDLYLRERASPSARERNLTFGITGGLGDVRDVDVSYDGTKLVFSLRLPQIENAQVQPTWNLWEYDIPSDQLTQLIELDAEAGEDLAPHYLPDGRIVFSSTRQRQARAILIDEGKEGFAALTEDRQDPALNLHVLDSNGGIRQISFNQSHDLDPTVLGDGGILFSRWDGAGGRSAVSLYRIEADGTGLTHHYGAHSHTRSSVADVVQFLQPRVLEDGRVLSLVMPFGGSYLGGRPMIIDTATYSDNTTALYPNTGRLTGPAQRDATSLDLRTVGPISPGGRMAGAYPLYDGSGRLLVSWSLCRLTRNGESLPCTESNLALEGVEESLPGYGVWIYDPASGTQLPVVPAEPGRMIVDAVVARPRPRPATSTPGAIDGGLVDYGVGQLHIRSVYDFAGTATANIETLRDPNQTTAADRPARYLRLIKPASLPGRDVLEDGVPPTAFGRSNQQGMRQIIGYVPVEPDGSVLAKVPADTALALEVVDADGRRIGDRHLNWLQVRAGETVSCNGCHLYNRADGHGRRVEPPAANPGAPADGLFPGALNALWADIGDDMALTRARHFAAECGKALADLDPELLPLCARDASLPNPDLVYRDVWTDPGVRAPDADEALRYADLATAAPVTAPQCLDDPLSGIAGWSANCRSVIHYVEHIQPLWDRDRRVLAADEVTVVSDTTCTSCHSRTDAMGQTRIPAAQLELVATPSNDQQLHLTSYRELLFPDNAQEVVEGSLQDQLVPATDGNGDPIYQTDAQGNIVYEIERNPDGTPVLDENDEPVLALDASGNPIPIPVMVNVTVTPSMLPTGARFGRFMALFDAGGSHAGYLSAAELRLIAEWLDLGAQYYNDPFAVPLPE